MIHFQSTSTFSGDVRSEIVRNSIVHTTSSDMDTSSGINATDDAKMKLAQKSGSFESALPSTSTTTIITAAPTMITLNNNFASCKIDHKKKLKHYPVGLNAHIPLAATTTSSSATTFLHHHHHKHKQRRKLKMQLQFDDQFMDCGNFNEFLSSSSLSSSDSETEETNESDHEGKKKIFFFLFQN